MPLEFIIRKIKKCDIEACITLFQQTVHSVNAKDYTPDQLDAWAPLVEAKCLDNYGYWETLLNNMSYAAEYKNMIIGFADLTDKGYLDRLFVHKDFQGMGVATRLVNQLEKEAHDNGIPEITTHASITAKPFFEKMGFKVMKQQEWPIRGIALTNFVMKKKVGE